MTYLLVCHKSAADHPPDSPVDSTLTAGKFQLLVEPGTGLRVLESSPLSATGLSPLWIVFQGYLHDASLTKRNRTTGTSIRNCLDEIETRLQQSGNARALDSLQGNFTLLLVEPKQEYIRVQRDVLGGRTAYWMDTPHMSAISTSSARIAHLPGVSDAPDPTWMACHFATPSIRPIGHSAFDRVHQLLPGEILGWRDGQRSTHRRTLNSATGNRPRSEQEWIEEFSSRFKRAVLDCLPAEHPPAIMLSGGLDSAPIAGVIAKCNPDLARATTATSWALEQFPACDEARWIREVAQYTGLGEAVFEASHMLPFSNLDSDQVVPDAPYFNAFRPLINGCYEQAAVLQHPVILNGHAGDAIYPPSRLLLKAQIRSGDLPGAADSLSNAVRKQGLFGLHRDPSVRAIFSGLRRFKPLSRRRKTPAWLSEHTRKFLPEQPEWPPEAEQYPWPDYARQLLGQRIGSGTALEQASCTRFGIERRDPFVNEELIRLMIDMPFSMSWRDRNSKWIMREVIRQEKLLPDAIIRKAKTGNLEQFYAAGLRANRDRIRSFLSEHDQWQEWVKPEFVWRALEEGPLPETKLQLLVGQCIGYSLWRQKLEGEKNLDAVARVS